VSRQAGSRLSSQTLGGTVRVSLLWSIACLALLQGCFPRSVIVHDGLKTKIVDSVTKEPVGNAFVYDHLKGQSPHVLALSNEKGEILLDPKRRLTLSGLMGEALIFKYIWVCRDGYIPHLAGYNGGWNADYGPSTVYTPTMIELTKSSLAPAQSCLALKY
jgi:hypothetical protein